MNLWFRGVAGTLFVTGTLVTMSVSATTTDDGVAKQIESLRRDLPMPTRSVATFHVPTTRD